MSLLMMTKEEALRRFKAAKQTKKDAVAALEEKMKATHVGILHPYQFCVFEDEMQEIIKTYTYAYSGEEI